MVSVALSVPSTASVAVNVTLYGPGASPAAGVQLKLAVPLPPGIKLGVPLSELVSAVIIGAGGPSTSVADTVNASKAPSVTVRLPIDANTGRSLLSLLTVTVTVAVAVPPRPSLIV